MKTIVHSLIAAIAISFCSTHTNSLMAQEPPPPNQPQAIQPVGQDQPITMQTFYDELSPYGQCVNYGDYGYVFIPNAGPGFIPYATAGHWAYTEQFGWTWASDYPWGWAAFHYGRWNYDRMYGWFWIPDLQWGPAWVVWRNSPQYYGWAPLPFGVNLSMDMDYGYGIPADHWCFVPNQFICDPFISRYYLPRINNDIFMMHTAIINRMYFDNDRRYNYFAGPERFEVERYHRGPIEPVEIRFNSDRNHAYGHNEIGMYRPEGRHDDRHDDRRNAPAPIRPVRMDDVPRRDANHQHDDHRYDNHNEHREEHR